MEHQSEEILYPRPRWLDNEIVEVKRYGETVRRCFTDLTEEEQSRHLSTLSDTEVKRLCISMAGAVRGFGDICDLSFVGEE